MDTLSKAKKKEFILENIDKILQHRLVKNINTGKFINFIIEKYNFTFKELLLLNTSKIQNVNKFENFEKYLSEHSIDNIDRYNFQSALDEVKQELDDYEIFKPSQSNNKFFNTTLYEFRIQIYNFLVDKYQKGAIVSNLKDEKLLDDMERKRLNFIENFEDFTQKFYFTSSNDNLHNITLTPDFIKLFKNFSNYVDYKFYFNSNFKLEKDLNNFSSSIVPRSFTDILKREKELFETKNYELVFYRTLNIFNEQYNNLNLVKEVYLLSTQEQKTDKQYFKTWNKDNYILTSQVPNNISLQFNKEVIDFKKVKDMLVSYNMIPLTENCEQYLKKFNIENDPIAISLGLEILQAQKANFGYIDIKLRLNRTEFKNTIEIVLPFDINYFKHVYLWDMLSKDIFNRVDNYIKDDDERYNVDKNIIGIEVLSLKLKFFKIDKEKIKNYTYGEVGGKLTNLCLLKALIYYLRKEKVISYYDYDNVDDILKFLKNFDKKIQDKIILGDTSVIHEIEDFYRHKIRFLNLNHREQIDLSTHSNNKNLYLVAINSHCRLFEGIPEENKYIMKKNKFTKKPYVYVSWDLETFTDDKYIYGNQTPYCCCTYSSMPELILDIYGTDCCEVFISKLFTISQQHKKTIFSLWSHNGSKFDNQFIFKILLQKFGSKIELIGTYLDKKQIKCGNIIFNDFCCFFKASLDNVCKSFKLPGKTSINLTKITKDNYIEHKDEVLKYCSNDSKILYDCLIKFTEVIKNLNLENFDYSFQNICTASSFAAFILKEEICKDNIVLEGHSHGLYDIEKSSYHGGFTMLFKKYCPQGYIYDINSSYPNSLRQNLPYALDNSFVYDKLNYNMQDLDLVEVTYTSTTQDKICFLPTILDDNSLIYLQNSCKKMWYWGIEIKAHIKIGFKFKIFNVIRYKGKPFMKNFINKFYNLRREEKQKPDSNSTLAEVYKLILNSIYGKMGQRKFYQSQIIKKDQIQNLYTPLIKSCEVLDEDYILVRQNDPLNEYNWIGSLVRIASFVTANSRVNLFEPYINNDIQYENIFYTDTDSLFLNCILPDKYLSDSELGKFKLENKFIEFYGIAPKLYTYIKTKTGEEVCKIKSGKQFFENISQFDHNKIKYLSLQYGNFFEIENLQFSRTIDSNILIQKINKTITNSFCKRVFIENDSTLHSSLDSYIQYKQLKNLELKKIQKNKKDCSLLKTLDKNEKKIEELIIKDNLQYTTENIIQKFLNDELKNVTFISEDNIKKKEILLELEKQYGKQIPVYLLYYILNSKLFLENKTSLILSELNNFKNISIDNNDIFILTELELFNNY